MLLTVIGVIAAAIAIVLIVAAQKPDTFRLSRSIVIAAPPEKIVPHIEDFHRWSAWSPWEKMDPAMTRTYDGPERGPGAVYTWNGNNKVGEGRMEILEVGANRVVVDLQFFKPFKAHNKAEFDLVPAGSLTNVTWAMTGPLLFMAKVMHVLMPIDKMVGKDFESGLEGIKAQAEA